MPPGVLAQAAGPSARTVYSYESVPLANPFTALWEGFMAAREPATMLAFKNWLTGQNPKARLALIGDLAKQRTELAKKAASMQIAFDSNLVEQMKVQLGYAENRSRETIAQMGLDEAKSREQIEPNNEAYFTTKRAQQDAKARMQAALNQVVPDVAAANAAAADFAKYSRDMATLPGLKPGERNQIDLNLQNDMRDLQLAIDGSAGKIEGGAPGPSLPNIGNVVVTETPKKYGSPGFPGFLATGPSVSISTSNSGTVPRGGGGAPPAAGGAAPAQGSGGGRAAPQGQGGAAPALGGGGVDPALTALDRDLARLIHGVEVGEQWTTGGDDRDNPYGPLAPLAPKMKPRQEAEPSAASSTDASEEPGSDSKRRTRRGDLASLRAMNADPTFGMEGQGLEDNPTPPLDPSQVNDLIDFKAQPTEPAKKRRAAAISFPQLPEEGAVRSREELAAPAKGFADVFDKGYGAIGEAAFSAAKHGQEARKEELRRKFEADHPELDPEAAPAEQATEEQVEEEVVDPLAKAKRKRRATEVYPA